MSSIKLNVTPMGAPRMVQSDSWKKRPVVQRYWAYKDEIVLGCRGRYVQGSTLFALFIMPMPESWSNKKKLNMFGCVNQSRPDTDNIAKGVLDSLLVEDSNVHVICAAKVWGTAGEIVLFDDFQEWSDNFRMNWIGVVS